MAIVRIALANLPVPSSPQDSVARAEDAIDRAGAGGALVVCFPEAFIPGYRRHGIDSPPPDAEFLERAWTRVANAAKRASVCVALGTERIVNGALRLSVL